MKKYKFAGIVIPLFFFAPVFSQDKSKVEIEINREQDVVSAGTVGPKLAFTEVYLEKPVGKKQKINFTFYDQQLKEKNTVEAEVNVGEKYQGSYSDSNGVYSLYAKVLSGDFSLLYCDGKDVKVVNGTLGAKAECKSIHGFGNAAIILASDKNRNDFIITADFSATTTNQILLNAENPKFDVSVLSTEYLLENKEFAIVYSLSGKNSRKMSVLFLDEKLAKKNTIVLSDAADQEKYLMTASVNAVAKDEYLISGTYQNEKGDFANGMYIGRFKDNTWAKNNYYSFTKDFTHFTDYLSEKGKEKLEKKKDKADAKGDEYDVDVLMLTHKLYKLNQTYVLVGEIYYPEYQRYTDTRGVTTNVFVGYRYPQALIVGFDETLEKKWDQSFAIGMLGGFLPVEVIHITPQKDALAFYFANGNTIQSKNMDETGKTVSEHNVSCVIADEGEEVRAMYTSKVEYWHDDIFIASGSAKTKNNQSGDKAFVFYFSPMSLEKGN